MMNATRIRFISIILVFCGICALHAQDGKMLDASDTVLEWEYLDLISRGRNPPTTVQSISTKEAAFYGLQDRQLEDANNEARFRGIFSIQPFLLGWRGLDTSDRMTNTSLLTRFRLEDPILALGVSFENGAFYGSSQLDFGTDSVTRYAAEDGMTAMWQPMDYLSYWTFPEEAYVAWSADHLTFAAGRLPAGIGLGKSNIFLNGEARWYDQAQFSWWSDRFRFFGFWGTSSSHLDGGEYAIQDYSPTLNDGKSWGWDTLNNHDASTQSLVPFKMFTYHRLEFKPVPKLGIGISEMQLVGGKVPDLTNLLPTLSWHNTYTAGISNVMLLADVWSVPVRGLLLYGEFLMDDSKAPKEDGEAKPQCWAWELGTVWVLPAESRDWRFSARAEYSHADKWTYNRWQPYLTMYQRQLITGGHRGFDIPLGHPEGGDVDQGSLTLAALSRDGKRIELGYTYINKGPVYLGMTSDYMYPVPDGSDATMPMYLPVYYDYDDYAGSGALAALLGTVRKHSHVINLKAAWPLGRGWEAKGEIDFRIILNAGHIASETATETVYKTGFKWTYGK